jgi:hypothetical protein
MKMIKKFEQFVSSLNESDDINHQYIVNHTNITSGSKDLTTVRNFVTEMTKMSAPQGENNIGRFIEFCVDNYHGFKGKESQDLAAEVDKIKEMIKSFFANTEIEMEMLKSAWFGGFKKKTDTDVTVDAVFGKDGMLRKFFETFWKTKQTTKRNSQGLDNSVYDDIKSMVQRLKEDWDPVGWDAYTWIGGDSNAVEAFQNTLEERYGAYADAKIAYLNGQYEPPTGNKPGEKTTGPVNRGSVKSDTTGSSTTQQATTTMKKSTAPTKRKRGPGTTGIPISLL